VHRSGGEAPRVIAEERSVSRRLQRGSPSIHTGHLIEQPDAAATGPKTVDDLGHLPPQRQCPPEVGRSELVARNMDDLAGVDVVTCTERSSDVEQSDRPTDTTRTGEYHEWSVIGPSVMSARTSGR
jgi:hypothetical protein